MPDPENRISLSLLLLFPVAAALVPCCCQAPCPSYVRTCLLLCCCPSSCSCYCFECFLLLLLLLLAMRSSFYRCFCSLASRPASAPAAADFFCLDCCLCLCFCSYCCFLLLMLLFLLLVPLLLPCLCCLFLVTNLLPACASLYPVSCSATKRLIRNQLGMTRADYRSKR